MRCIQLSVCVLCGLLAGCGSPSPAGPPPPEPPSQISTAFDAAKCGRVAGRVTWGGDVPVAPQFHFSVPTTAGSFEMRSMANPNQPHVDPATKGVAGAVVWLAGIDLAKSKPWDVPPARVEMRDLQIVVKQGDDAPKQAGFVRRGDVVPMASADASFHILRGRGAAYFSLPFPDPDRPLSRTFDAPGRVELSSGAGYYWAHANLFVADHPYFALTDREGRFAFDQVPAGAVRVVAWHPSCWGATQERDPETGLVARQTYAAPHEVMLAAQVEPGRTAGAELRLR